MASLSPAIGDTGVNQLYSKRVYRRAIYGTTAFNPSLGLVGKPGSEKPFINHNDFSVQSGGQIECKMTGQLDGDGWTGAASLAGQETRLGLETVTFNISTVKSPVTGIDDEQSQQYTQYNVEAANRDASADWMAHMFEAGVFMQLAGATFTTAKDYYKPNGRQIRANITGVPGVPQHVWTFQNATSTPTSGRIVYPNARTAAQDIDSNDPLSTALVNKMIRAATLANPPIIPAKIFGTRAYLLFVHLTGRDQLLESGEQYEVVQRAIIEGGESYSKSAFSGANLKPWNNCFIIPTIWSPPAQNSSTAAALDDTRVAILAGANAFVMGFGRGHKRNRIKWRQEKHNLGAVRWAAATLCGGRKVVWTAEDATTRDNVIVAPHYALDQGDTG